MSPVLLGLSLISAAFVVAWVACESWLARRGRPGYVWDDIADTPPAHAAHTHHCTHCGTWITQSGPAEACTTDWRCA